MATTTNYGWTTPDDTALVKDGASAIRTLGSSVDTTTKNLNPQTTTGAIAYRSSTSNVNTSLPIGTAGQVLTVNSGATAPEWATSSSGGLTLLSTTNLSGISTTISSINQTYTNLLIVVQNAYVNSATQFRINLNGSGSSVAMSQVSGGTAGTNPNLATVSNLPTASGSESHSCLVSNYSNSTYTKPVIFYGSIGTSASNSVFMGGISVDTTAITTFDVATLNGTSTFSGGRVLVYGVK